jgi:hypothetical protein
LSHYLQASAASALLRYLPINVPPCTCLFGNIIEPYIRTRIWAVTPFFPVVGKMFGILGFSIRMLYNNTITLITIKVDAKLNNIYYMIGHLSFVILYTYIRKLTCIKY